MGSVTVSQAVSDLVHRPYTMLGAGASASVSSQPATSTTTTTSSTAAASDPSFRAARHPHIDPATAPSSTSTSFTAGSNRPPSHCSHSYGPGSTVQSSFSSGLQDPAAAMTYHPNPQHHPPGRQRSFYDPSHQNTQGQSQSSQSSFAPSPSSPQLHPTYRSSQSLDNSQATSPSRIKVRNLSHIQSFANEEVLAASRTPGQQASGELGRQYEISSMPVTDIIEMVAGLLTKITTTNDSQHEHIQRPMPAPEGTSSLNEQTTSMLAFHGKNVPSITILSYLSRIHKYCPTTYEVFLSLLVYFDRMTEMVNNAAAEAEGRPASKHSRASHSASSPTMMSSPETPQVTTSHPSMVTPPSSSSVRPRDHQNPPSPVPPTTDTIPPSMGSSIVPEEADIPNLSQYFVVDSYNIHRLVIAGVTCASKFFSDVFYTNSRYAKVGGLPLLELNHLELQFLILNNFRLAIAVEELEAYGTMLVEFYAREIVAQQQLQMQHTRPQLSSSQRGSSYGEDVYMRDTNQRQRGADVRMETEETPTPG